MPNIAAALKEEVTRLARKEIRSQMGATVKAVAQYRRDIAALKRRVQALERAYAALQRRGPQRQAPAAPDGASGVRFSAKGLKANRERLGLSAKDFGALVGVSGLTIYNWEQEKSRPREKNLAALAQARDLGKREAAKRLEALRG
jgi:DNA-binding transcriptional regulator YiaG